MTIISGDADHWIEYFHVARSSVTSGSRRNTDHTLTKAGRFIGGSITQDSEEPGGFIGLIGVSLLKTNNTQLVYGDLVTQVRSICSNGNASTQDPGEHVLIFMRK